MASMLTNDFLSVLQLHVFDNCKQAVIPLIPLLILHLKGGITIGLGVTKSSINGGNVIIFHFSGASHSGNDHSTNKGLSPSVAGMSQLFHSVPDQSPIQYSGAKLEGDPQTIRRGGLKDEHWNTFIIIFYQMYSNSSFYIPWAQIWRPPCSLQM